MLLPILFRLGSADFGASIVESKKILNDPAWYHSDFIGWLGVVASAAVAPHASLPRVFVSGHPSKIHHDCGVFTRDY